MTDLEALVDTIASYDHDIDGGDPRFYTMALLRHVLTDDQLAHVAATMEICVEHGVDEEVCRDDGMHD